MEFQHFNIAYLVILFVFGYSLHRYYSRRLGFNKIKKYLDLRENDLSDRYQRKLRDLEDASINFDIDLKKFNQVSEVVNHELTSLDKKIAVFQEIDSRLNSRLEEYNTKEKIISEFVDEVNEQLKYSREAEEGLKKIHESINDADDRLSRLDNACQTLQDELSSKYTSNYENFKTQLNADLKNYIEQSEEKIAVIEKAIQEKINITSENLKKQEAVLTDQMEQYQASSQKQVDIFFEEEKENAARQLGEVAGTINERLETIEGSINDLHEQAGQIYNKNKILSEEIDKNKTDLMNRSNDISEEILDSLKVKVNKYQNSIDEELRSRELQLSKGIEEMKKNLEQSEEDIINKVDDKFADIQKSINEYAGQLKSQVDDITGTYNEIKTDLISRSKDEIEALNSNVTTLRADFSRLDEANREKVTATDDYLKEVEQLKKDIRKKAEAFSGKLEKDLYKEGVFEFNKLKKELSKIKASKDEKLQALYKAAETTREKLNQDIDKQMSRYNSDINNKLSEVDARIAGVDEMVGESRDYVIQETTSKIEDFRAEVQRLATAEAEFLEEKRRDMEDKVDLLIRQTTDSMNKELSKQINIKSGELDKKAQELNSIVEENSKNLATYRDSAVKSIEELKNSTIDRIVSENDSFQKQEKENTELFLKELNNSTNQKIDEFEMALQTLSNEVNEISDKHDQMNEDISLRRTEILAADFSDDVFQKFQDKLAKYSKELEGRISDLRSGHADLTKDLPGLQKNVASIDKAIAQAGNQLKDFNNKSKDMKNELDNMNTAYSQLFEQKKKDMIAAYKKVVEDYNNGYKNSSQEAEKKFLEICEGFKRNLAVESDKTMQDFFNELKNRSNNCTETSNALQKEINEKGEAARASLEKELNARLKALKDFEQGQKDNIINELHEVRQSAREKLNVDIGTIIDGVNVKKQEIEKAENELKEKLKNYSDESSRIHKDVQLGGKQAAEILKNELNNKMRVLKEFENSQKMAILDHINKSKEQVQKKIEDMTAKLIKTTDKKVNDYLSEKEDIFGEKYREFFKQLGDVSARQNVVNQMKHDLDEIKTAKTDVINRFGKEMKEKVNDSILYFDKCYKDYVESFNNANKDAEIKLKKVYDMNKSKLDEMLGTITKETKDHFNSTVSDLNNMNDEARASLIKIRQVSTDAEKSSKQSLSALKQDYTLKADKALNSYMEALKSAQEKATGDYALVQEQIKSRFADLVSEREVMFADLTTDKKKDIEKLAGRISDELKEQENLLKEEIREFHEVLDKRGELEKAVYHFDREVEKNEKQVQNRNDKFQQKTEGLLKNFIKFKETRQKEMNSLGDKALSEYKKSLTSDGMKHLSDLEGRVNSIIVSARSRTAAVQRDFREALEASENCLKQYDDRFAGFIDQKESAFSDTMYKIDRKRSDIDSTLKDLKSRTRGVKGMIKEGIDKVLVAEQKAIRKSLQLFEDQQKNELRDAFRVFSRELTDEMNSEKDKFLRSFDKLGDKAKAAKTGFDKKLGTHLDLINKKVEEIDQVIMRSHNEVLRKVSESKVATGGQTVLHSADLSSAEIDIVKNQDLKAWVQKVRDFKITIESDIKGIKKAVAGLSVKKDKRVVEFQHDLEAEIKKYYKKISRLSEKYEKVEANLELKSDQKINSLLSRIVTGYKEGEKLIKERTLEFDKIKSDAEGRIKALSRESQEVMQQGRESLTEIQDKATALEESFTVRLKDFTGRQKTRMQKAVTELEQQISASCQQLREQGGKDSQSITSEFKETAGRLNDMAEELQSSISTSILDGEKKIEAFVSDKEAEIEKNLGSIETSLTETEQRLTSETTKKFAEIDGQLKTIEQKMSKFVDKTGLFEKVDQLQNKIEADIEAYGKRIQDVRFNMNELNEVEKKLKEYKKSEKDIRGLLDRIILEKKEIHSVDEKLKTIHALYGKIDEHVQKADNYRETIDQYHAYLDQYTNEMQQMRDNYDEISRSRKEVEKTISEYHELASQKDGLISGIREMESRLDSSAALQKEISKRLSEIDERTVLIEANHQKIQQFSDKYDHLEMALLDVEQRQKTIEKLRQDLASDKENMIDLKNNLNEQLKTTLKVKSGRKGKKNPEPAPAEETPEIEDNWDEYENRMSREEVEATVSSLDAIGWNKEDIAAHLKIEEYEVEVILEKLSQSKV